MGGAASPATPDPGSKGRAAGASCSWPACPRPGQAPRGPSPATPAPAQRPGRPSSCPLDAPIQERNICWDAHTAGGQWRGAVGPGRMAAEPWERGVGLQSPRARAELHHNLGVRGGEVC